MRAVNECQLIITHLPIDIISSYPNDIIQYIRAEVALAALILFLSPTSSLSIIMNISRDSWLFRLANERLSLPHEVVVDTVILSIDRI